MWFQRFFLWNVYEQKINKEKIIMKTVLIMIFDKNKLKFPNKH